MPSASEGILARLQALHPKRIDLSLERIDGLLEALGRPERRLAPVVHVAGTNGKGSTLAFLDAMLASAGQRVQRYISPHLVAFNERILLGGLPVDDARLTAALDACEQANAGRPITFFEITTAAAFLIFAAEPADVLLLETGLGGRLDATNLVERPRLTLVTPISMDHEAFLGTTLDAIAFEKAGIMKPGVPVLAGPQAPAAAAVLTARARAVGAPLRLAGRDWEAAEAGGRLLIRDNDVRLDLPLPALPGAHQLQNAALAVVAARALGKLAPDLQAIERGLVQARWPARLQRLKRGPMLDALGEAHELWLDGGHNPAAGEALAASLPGLLRGRPLHLVVGMLANKDAARFLAPLAPLTASLTAVTITGESNALPPEALAATARACSIAAGTSADPLTAVQRLAGQLDRPSLVLVCGSLYLAGQLLREHG